ncbi:MAG: ATP-dependent zinc metalloprotease FtsH [Clostridia bacterium]|nr:ATP-dependent zinc metalloprotease FtsH [Clostridia bacterium]
MKKKSNILTLLFYFVIIGAIIFGISMLLTQKNEEEKFTYDDMVAMFEENRVYGYARNINKYTVLVFETKEDWDKYFDDDNKTKASYKTAKLTYEEYDSFFGVNAGYKNSILSAIQDELNATEEGSMLEKTYSADLKQQSMFMQYLPIIIVVVIFGIIMFVMMRQQGGGKMGGFGKSKAVQAPTKAVTFEDVAGADEEKEELKEVVEYLRNPSKFTHLGAKIPHGVLLVGPPGTGKTLLAKAVAGEAGVPFFSMSGSDFVELYVGVGASRVRDLFEQARKSPAAIIFIDEIDAVGRQRGAGLGGGHDEREQTLNQLLVEMDGFSGHSGIIVMAATNRPDILDSALLRPGRFDRQITIGYPDLTGREAILNVHAKGKPFEETVDFHKIAQTTVGFTGADLANLLNEAALLAARRSKTLIGMSEIEDSWIKVSMGTQKKSRMTEKEKYNTAIHEAGHAILAHILPKLDPVRLITIIPSGRALGFTFTPPTEDKYSESKQEMLEEITMALGGRVAEEIMFGDYTGGASGDIQSVTQIARKMVTVYGMSEELGTIRYGSQHNEVFLGRDFGTTPDYSETTAAKIDSEIKRIVDECYKRAYELLTQYKEKLIFVADFLVRNESMDEEQFAYAMDNDVTMEEVEALVTEKKRRSEEENKRRAERLAEEKRLAEEERHRLERELGLLDDDEPVAKLEKADENTEEALESTQDESAQEENIADEASDKND